MTTQCHIPGLARKSRVNQKSYVVRGSPDLAQRSARSGDLRRTGSTGLIRAFQRDLVRWYRLHHRKLPWRATRNPYKIWVSEIMLQQTRVEVVRDYYNRWLRAFPTVESLAETPYSHVLKLWEGLGYYSRAKNLHRAARILMHQHKGKVPQTAEQLQELPGIGPYTAGAIASIAFGQRVPLVDGNVARVFARIFNIRAAVTKPAIQKRLWIVAETLLPDCDPGTFNQALMELGALVCTPVNPRCVVCPMARVCTALSKSIQNELPNRGDKRPHKLVVHDAALIQRDGRILLQRRPSKGLLAGMWELPPLEEKRSRMSQPVLSIRHTITNRRITLRIFACQNGERVKSGGRLRWISPRNLERLTLPAAHRRALERIFPAASQISGNCSSPAGMRRFRNNGNRVMRGAGARTVASG
jgi:A/G-specific adenine glycosylase